MSTGLRWGILGAGGIARLFTADLRTHGFAVTAVGARSRDSASAFATEFGIPHSYGSYADLVADPEVDVVYVATLHPSHATHARLALEAGKHVLVEKPFTMDADQARAIVDLAAAKGLVVLEAMWTRWLPHMVRIREILESGVLGQIRTVSADHDQRIDHIDRLARPELGGGGLLDLGIYPVSFAWDVLGAPNSVLAQATMTELGVDRQTSLLLGYDSGAHAVLQIQMDAVGPNRAAIIGTDGRIEIDPVWYTPASFTRYAGHEIAERYESRVEGRGMHYQAAELERLVADGTLAGAILPPEESVAIMATLDEVRALIGLRYPDG